MNPKRLKILLVGNYSPDKQESMQRFAHLLRRELKAMGCAARLIQPQPYTSRLQTVFPLLSKWLGYVDKFVLFPFLLVRVARRFDVVHVCDHSNGFYLNFLQKKPHLITCNDVLAIRSALGFVPENITGWSGKILQAIILRGIKKAQFAACISENTRKELLEVSDMDPDKTGVVYMGINYPYTPMKKSEAAATINALLDGVGSPPHFIFHVGGNQWYKNRLGVLKIYQELRCAIPHSICPFLIMAGQPFTAEMRDFVELHQLGEVVFEVQQCSNEQLRAFYSAAQVTVFPSLAEGFGWPVVEAQACGCRVVTSDFAPLTEIGGDAAIYCEPRDEAKVAQEIASLLDESQEDRAARIAAGLNNAEQFSAEKMMSRYLDLYHTVAQS